jgi:hypothetical protein
LRRVSNSNNNTRDSASQHQQQHTQYKVQCISAGGKCAVCVTGFLPSHMYIYKYESFFCSMKESKEEKCAVCVTVFLPSHT